MRAIATLAAASALAFAGAVAFAQTTPSAPPAMQGRGIDPAPNAAPGRPQKRLRWRNTLRDALTDARIAGIQAGLKLNADQQRLWASVEQAILVQAAERAERIEQRLERRPTGGPKGHDRARDSISCSASSGERNAPMSALSRFGDEPRPCGRS